MEIQEHTFEITSVKEVEGGWLVNDNMTVPNDPSNRDYVVVQKWIDDGGVIEPKLVITESELALVRLQEIDRLSIRPLRAVSAGTDTQEDRDFLATLEQEAITLRSKI